MDDLEKICDKLENCSKEENCNKNEIVCTKAILQSYIEGDDNKRLKLKALMKQHEKSTFEMIMEVFSIYGSIAALGVSCVALMVSADKKSAEHVGIIVLFVLGILGGVLIISAIMRWVNGKYSNIDKWKKYIQVVLEDMECKIEDVR